MNAFSLFESIKIIKKLHQLSAAIRDAPVDSGGGGGGRLCNFRTNIPTL